MKVALGSANEDKIKILQETLGEFDPHLKIKGVKVSSEIGEQPLSEEKTIRGAIKRAVKALEIESEADFSVGLEGGLQKIEGGGYFLICAAAICDKNGQIFLGLGSKLQLPRKVSEEIKKGGFFGIVIRDYEKGHKEDRNLKSVTQFLIKRREPFSEAMRNAYFCYKNKKHY